MVALRALPPERQVHRSDSHAHAFDTGVERLQGVDIRTCRERGDRFDDSERARFAASIRRWWPPLKDEELTPDFVGVRPKLTGPNEPNADFVIQDSGTHGVPGLVNLFGIESPGLTSSLAIGEDVRQRLEQDP